MCYILLLIRLLIIPYQAQNMTTTTFMSTPTLTVSPLVVGYLQTKVGNTYNITAQYCHWNVTLMLHLMNATDPNFLYDPTTKTLLVESGYLPEYIIRKFPPDLLSFYGLNYTAAQSQECGSSDQGTPPPLEIDFCVGPLIHTDLLNPVNKDAETRRISLKNLTGLDMFINASLSDCGLACNEGGKMYGLTDTQQKIVDLFKITGCSICFVSLIFLGINQYFDQKRTGKTFTNKSLLQVIPYLITLALFLVTFSMALGEIIGKEVIVCSDHNYVNDGDDKRKEFTFYNPIHGKNAVCTIQGLFFYSSLLMYQFYTVLLSFVLFRQLYAPMRPLWGIGQKYFHIAIFLLVLILSIVSVATSSYSGIWPMGVCLPGTSVKNELVAFINLPFTISASSAFLLLFGAAYYLKKRLIEQTLASNSDRTVQIQDLLHRLIYYGIGVVACLMLLCVTSFAFYFKTDALKNDMNRNIECELSKILLDPQIVCPKRAVKISPFYFISWIIAATLGVGAQIVLSCHNEARERIKRAAMLKDVGIGSKLGEVRDKMREKTKSKSMNLNGISVGSQSPVGSPRHSNNRGSAMINTDGENGVELVGQHNDIILGGAIQNAVIAVHSEDEDTVPITLN